MSPDREGRTWLTLSSRALAAFSSTARAIFVGLVTVRSSPTTAKRRVSVKMRSKHHCVHRVSGRARPEQPRVHAQGPSSERVRTLHIGAESRDHLGPIGPVILVEAILDRDDPTVVVARGATPALTATLPFETTGHTPKCVFADGLRPMGNDEFMILFGAADTDVGGALVKIVHKTDDAAAALER